ncbi:MAG: hypothetical protein HYR96_08325 [Deltaproteobacteria bacterium]|nr:hypothetical protein [Deltaproteobacteria bacterium]MBI3294970.1 hypothetical protein [Deltaproteobacteria bacterium]
MQALYFILAALHLVAIVVTGVLWIVVVLFPKTGLEKHLHSIRAVHFGSLYLASLFLGIAYALKTLNVPSKLWLPFPAGLGLLVFFSGVGYLIPRPSDLDPFYYWTKGWALALALIGTLCLITGLCWTAAVLVVYGAF